MQRFFYPLIEPLNMHPKFHILLVWDYFQNCFFFYFDIDFSYAWQNFTMP